MLTPTSQHNFDKHLHLSLLKLPKQVLGQKLKYCEIYGVVEVNDIKYNKFLNKIKLQNALQPVLMSIQCIYWNILQQPRKAKYCRRFEKRKQLQQQYLVAWKAIQKTQTNLRLVTEIKKNFQLQETCLLFTTKLNINFILNLIQQYGQSLNLISKRIVEQNEKILINLFQK
ncbi:unnamed protein product [Paramecium octaurelia]|uniref:Uncharacterized protein n=1 Tax=Paramecium octaurelia TaxID=43137 RepID=A0A8S1YNA2_PAROT|nr:unnamed protein product [Paramecium octaurelia]